MSRLAIGLLWMAVACVSACVTSAVLVSCAYLVLVAVAPVAANGEFSFAWWVYFHLREIVAGGTLVLIGSGLVACRMPRR
jgi:hypothetical protein